ncbi:hypothetical protein CTheo_7130 [Ceratobasidium theobromae]|uniref:Uncharacterized protein n=1 Tax=Ceratobasidium theobromae TaxID=1582974 RepID=A0A5N5QDB7_9AGAM|nr:hypothetical protein CTheo_7130 [Ceratobasidium theobromae]
MALAFLTGNMYCPANGELVISTETFTVHGHYADDEPKTALPLSVLAIGIVRGILENNTTLETEVYHCLQVPVPTAGALLLGWGALSHFNQDGLAFVLIDSVLFFSFNPNSSRPTVQTPGKGKHKSELTGPPACLTPSPKKTKPDPPPFGPHQEFCALLASHEALDSAYVRIKWDLPNMTGSVSS